MRQSLQNEQTQKTTYLLSSFFIVFVLSSLHSFYSGVDSEDHCTCSVEYSLVICRPPALWNPICKGILRIVKETLKFLNYLYFPSQSALFLQDWWVFRHHAVGVVLFTGKAKPWPRMHCLGVCSRHLLFYQQSALENHCWGWIGCMF